jgi:glucose-1-phosphate thymidylyltransferase
VVLEKGRARKPANLDASARIVEPVYIEDGVSITNSTIGPNVSIAAGTVVENSEVRESVVGSGSTIRNAAIHDSLIGDGVILEGVRGSTTVGDHSEVRITS